jgi:hypothetical protein
MHSSSLYRASRASTAALEGSGCGGQATRFDAGDDTAAAASAAAAATTGARQASRSAFHSLTLFIRDVAAAASDGRTSSSAHCKRSQDLRDTVGSWGYLDEEGFQCVTAANAGILSQPHSIVRVPLVRVADPAPELQGEDHSRPQAAPRVDLLLAALSVAAQEFLNCCLGRFC